MPIKGQHRHGDVALNPVSAEDREPLERGRIVLALGEATGHAHVLTGDVVMWSVEGQRYVKVGAQGATLTHEEHGVQTVAPGTYEVIIQREWSLEGEWQQVID
jgi:hypothetical protein